MSEFGPSRHRDAASSAIEKQVADFLAQKYPPSESAHTLIPVPSLPLHEKNNVVPIDRLLHRDGPGIVAAFNRHREQSEGDAHDRRERQSVVFVDTLKQGKIEKLRASELSVRTHDELGYDKEILAIEQSLVALSDPRLLQERVVIQGQEINISRAVSDVLLEVLTAFNMHQELLIQFGILSSEVSAASMIRQIFLDGILGTYQSKDSMGNSVRAWNNKGKGKHTYDAAQELDRVLHGVKESVDSVALYMQQDSKYQRVSEDEKRVAIVSFHTVSHHLQQLIEEVQLSSIIDTKAA